MDDGDTIFMGISTAGFIAGDTYDTTFRPVRILNERLTI
jgi:hypothetical protein